MSGYKVVRDAQGLCRGCGPDDGNYAPTIPPGGTLESSPVFVPIDQTAAETALYSRVAQDEIERQACKIDGAILPLVNMDKAGWIAWAGTNFPTLTAPEKNKLGQLFWVVSVGVRRSIRNGG